MKIIITIDKNILKQAIKNGWNDRYDEKLSIKDIKTVDNSEDIINAMRHLEGDNFTVEEVGDEKD